MGIRHWALAAAAFVILPHTAFAAEEGKGDKALASILSGMNTEVIDCQPHDRPQEEADTKLTNTAWDLIQKRDIAKLHAMLPELEAAGNRAPDRPSLQERCGDKIMSYSDDPSMGLMAALGVAAAADKGDPAAKKGSTNIVLMGALPYARLHFIIGWLYFEQGNTETADTWFARGLKNDPHHAKLASEHANALSMMGRSAEALTFVDAFLADNDDLADTDHALLLRRRGYCLGELRRHEEAIEAYNQSLKLVPGNTVAKEEIKWNKEQLKAAKRG